MAHAALALAALWSLAVAMGIDYSLLLTRSQRVVLLLGIAAAVVWAARRFAWPWFGHRETELDMALLVEREQKIDSDLVAALQFETPAARNWGSPRLETAVVDYVAEFGKSWNVFDGFPRRDVSRRMTLLFGSVLALGLFVALAPRYVAAFLDRLMLGAAHYPTATEIERVLVNGREIDALPGHMGRVKTPYGEPLKIVVETSGERPAAGAPICAHWPAARKLASSWRRSRAPTKPPPPRGFMRGNSRNSPTRSRFSSISATLGPIRSSSWLCRCR